MARVQTESNVRAEALQTIAMPRAQAVTEVADPASNAAAQLAQQLGAAGPLIDRLQQQNSRAVIEAQAMKIDAYKEQFMADHEGGAVTAAQVRERFPETVPVIAARIAEGIGAEYGRKATQSIVEEVMQNDELRLDSTKRNAFIAAKRAELIGGIDKGNDFYLNGFAKSVNNEVNQWENTWQRETAKYHQDVQANAFGEEVSKVLAAGGDLEALDASWKTSSSLNNLERNKIVVDAATKTAFETQNTAILDKIPTRFLNNDTRKAIAQTKMQVQSHRMSMFRDAQYIQNVQRENQLRASKVGILETIASGKQVDPFQYRNNPDAFDFALKIQNVGGLAGYQSAANAQTVRTEILNGSTLYSGLDQAAVTDAVLNNPNINPAEKKALIEEIPKLIEGRIAMDDPMVKNALDFRINARLKALESSSSSLVQQVTTGRNPRAEVMTSFSAGISQSFQTYYEDKKRWPTGADKQAIIDRETTKAEDLLEKITKPGGAMPPKPTSGTGAAPPAWAGTLPPTIVTSDGKPPATARPTPRTPETVQAKPLEKGAVVNGFTYKGGDPANRDNWEKK